MIKHTEIPFKDLPPEARELLERLDKYLDEDLETPDYDPFYTGEELS
ncbi:hypothetical protein LCGC14_0683740 [marine sediment metagenome]|uniref:Uncharacterized protein n=1 Tax=marine sediment metagenome TaxID=412755 RepID=A0A0F9TVK5_9ZZZZ